MPPTLDRRVQDEVAVDNEQQFLKEFQNVNKHKCKLFERSHFQEYAETLLDELVPNIVRNDHDLILFPLRGCRQPGILAKVMAGIPEDRIIVFNYTYATTDSQQALIRSELLGKFQQRAVDKAIVNIGVVDTAKGGHGSEHLAKIIAFLHEKHFHNLQWTVQFHLLHAQDKKPTIAYQIPKYSHHSLTLLDPLFYEVGNLLVEDWAEGIGLAVRFNGKSNELIRCTQPGMILLRDESTVQLIESENLSKLMTCLMVDEVNRRMLSDPQFKYLKDVLPGMLDRR